MKNNIIDDTSYFEDITPLLDMKHFVELLLADLASKTPIIYLDGRTTKTAVLSFYYKDIIQNIMYSNNGWGIKFAKIINIHSYYEYQQDWEKKLGNTVRKVLKDLNKEINYDLAYDNFYIEFTSEEISNIKKNFDSETLLIMDYFSNLVGCNSMNRNALLNIKQLERSINRASNN